MNRWSRDHRGEAFAEVRKAFSDDRRAQLDRPDLRTETGTGRQYKPHHVEVGERFGYLVVVSTEVIGHHKFCTCRCDCGRLTTRRAGNLTLAARRGSVQQCRDCWSEQRRARRDALRDLIAEAFRRQYVDYGTLWTAGQTRRLMREVREDLELHFGPAEEPPPKLDLAVGYNVEPKRMPPKKVEEAPPVVKDDPWHTKPTVMSEELKAAIMSLWERRPKTA